MFARSLRRLSLLGFAAGFSLMTVAPEAHASKYAVVDMRRAVLETEEGLRVQAQLKKVFDAHQADLDKKQTKLQQDKESLDKLFGAGKISQTEYQKKFEDLQRQVAELQQALSEYQREMQVKEGEMTNPIVNRVMTIVRRIAATEGYDAIFDKTAVAYIRSELELTDRLIQLFNAETGAKPAGPRPAAPPTVGAPVTPKK
jgi:outer membrane protein